MDFSTVTNTSSWGQEAGKVNENFQKTGSEINKLWNKTEGISSGQVTLGTVANLAALYAKVDPVKGDRWIVSDQKNPANNLPYYYVYKGNSSGQTGNIAANWSNTGETIMNADAATKADLANKADTTNAQGTLVRTSDGKIPEVDTSGLAPKENGSGNEVVYDNDLRLNALKDAIIIEELTDNNLLSSIELSIIAGQALDRNNGTASYSGFYYCETYLPIKADADYETSLPNSMPVILFYDASKTFIGYKDNNAVNLNPFGRFTTPPNTKYIRFNARSANVETAYYIKEVLKGIQFSNLFINEDNIIESGRVIKEAIPYSVGTVDSNGSWFMGYVNQGKIQGKNIHSIKVNAASKGTVSIGFANNIVTQDIVWQETHNVNVGENEIIINKILPASQLFCIRGVIKIKSGTNPVGGLLQSKGAIGLTYDLCVGVYTGSESASKEYANYAFMGDSTSHNGDFKNWTRRICEKLGFKEYQLALYASYCVGVEGDLHSLITQVDNLPDNFKGLITIMIGVNDMHTSKTLGVVQTALSKNYADLVPDNNFAESFRLAIERTLRKAPNASLVVISPLFTTWTGANPLQAYRDIQKEICEYYSIPYLDIWDKCGLSKFSMNAPLNLFADDVHPNNAGHEVLARYLYAKLLKYTKYDN